MRLLRTGRLLGLVVALVLVSSQGGRASEEPPLLWTVADDTLSVPIGTVADVAVGKDRVVYLLDIQNSAVIRIGVDGAELPSLGRYGEGPGEFLHPLFVTAHPGGGCIVVQDFRSPAVCLDASGRTCVGLDLSSIRDRFAITQFVGARSDDRGRLIVTAMTSDRLPDTPNATAKAPIAFSIFRLAPGDRAAAVLFSDREELCEKETVRIVRYAGSYTDRCWDINGEGRLIFADPSGRYRVAIGHPADGETRTLDLPSAKNDTRDIKKLAQSTGQEPGAIPLIASVYWLDSRYFLVKPMACVEARTSSRGGTFELFDTSGKSHGRAALRCDYDWERDGFFLRNGILVILKGGKSAIDASIRQKAAMLGKSMKPSASNDAVSDVIRVYAYDLAAHYARQ